MVFGTNTARALSPDLAGISAIIAWMAGALLVATTFGVPPFLLCSIVFIGAFVMMIPVWKLRGESVISKFRGDPKSYALGIFGMSNILFWYFGLKNAPVMEANLLNYLWPALIILFAAFFSRRMPGLFSIAGCLASFVGCYFIFAGDNGMEFSGGVVGLVSAIMGAVVWALYSVMTRSMAFASDRIPVFGLFVGIIAVILHLLTEQTVWPSGAQWLSVAALTVCQISYIMWDYAMKKGRVKMLASISYFIPLVSTLLLAAAGYSALSHGVVWGAVGIIGGCLLANLPMLLSALNPARVSKSAA